jgi:hypothetical protein
MTPEQQKIWDILTDEPYRYAVETGNELKACKSKEKLHKKLDIALEYLISKNDPERSILTFRLWVSGTCGYNLHVVPTKSKLVDQFCQLYGDLIKELSDNSELFDTKFNRFMKRI